MSLFKRLLRSALIAPFLIATADAVILDWNTVSWTAGSLSSSYDVDAAKHVGINGISFTPVPEINPAWSAVGSCLIAAALILRHSAKFRK
jgi:hypothetical protein